MFVEQSFGTVTNCYCKLTNQTLIKTSRKSQIGTETVVCVCLFVCFLSLCEWCWPWQCLCTALSRSLWRCGSDPAQWATLEAAQFFLLDRSLSLINGLHFVTVIVHFMIFCWESTYYLLHVCLFWQRAPFFVAHPVFPALILNRIKGLGKKLLYAVQIVKPLEAKCDCDPKTPKCTSKISLGKIPNPKLLHQCVNEWLSIQ